MITFTRGWHVLSSPHNITSPTKHLTIFMPEKYVNLRISCSSKALSEGLWGSKLWQPRSGFCIVWVKATGDKSERPFSSFPLVGRERSKLSWWNLLMQLLVDSHSLRQAGSQVGRLQRHCSSSFSLRLWLNEIYTSLWSGPLCCSSPKWTFYHSKSQQVNTSTSLFFENMTPGLKG